MTNDKRQRIKKPEANGITKKDAAKFWAKYFDATVNEALDCNHMTIDCLLKFAQEQVKKHKTDEVS